MALSSVRYWLWGCCARGWSRGGGCSGRRSCSGSSSRSFRGWCNSGGGCHCSCGGWLWFWGWIISRRRTRLGLLNHRGVDRVMVDLALQLTTLRRLLVLHKHAPFHSQAGVTV